MKKNDIVDFLGIMLGQRELVESIVDLHEIVNSAITKGKEIGARYSSTNVPITLVIGSEIPHMVVCDGVRVQQVLINLVSNAVKFTKAGKIIVSVSAEQKDLLDDNEYGLTISVKDSGIGIDTRYLKRMQLFFSQDPAINTLPEMGLTVSKYVSDLLGGRLWVESEIEQGSTFYFKFSCRTDGSYNLK